MAARAEWERTGSPRRGFMMLEPQGGSDRLFTNSGLDGPHARERAEQTVWLTREVAEDSG